MTKPRGSEAQLASVVNELEKSDSGLKDITYSYSTNNAFPESWLIQSSPRNSSTQLLDAITGEFNTTVGGSPNKPHYIDILQLGNRKVGDVFQEKVMNAISAFTNTATAPIVIRYLEGNSSKNSPSEFFTFIEGIKSDYTGPESQVTFYSASLDYPWLEALAAWTPGSWNHAKIIAIDGMTSIVGGQNYWQDYTGDNQPHDVSIQVNGDATIAAHQFANYLWQYVANSTTKFTVHKSLRLGDRQYGDSTPPQFNSADYPAPVQMTKIPILAVGNLGLWGDFESRTLGEELAYAAEYDTVAPSNTYAVLENATNPLLWFPFSKFDYAQSKAMQASTVARHLLLQQVAQKGRLRISQQKIADTDVTTETGYVPWPGEFLSAIVSALLDKKATVDIVVSSHDASSTQPQGGYTDDMGAAALQGVIVDLMSKQFDGNRAGAENIASDLLTVKEMPVGTNNHAKIWILDNSLFYVGSDNIYPGYLQEFGYITGDVAMTNDFITEYWDPIWKIAIAPSGPKNT